MGFLLFNVYPAKVFMGDTGSLALGGFVAGTAYMMQMPLFILIGRTDLSGRGAFCYDPGHLFQGNSRKAYFSRWHRSIIILNCGGWSETQSGRSLFCGDGCDVY